MDAWFQVLCATVMDAAGAKKMNGQRFTPGDFELKFEARAAAPEPEPRQTPRQMELLMREMVMINNARFGAPGPPPAEIA